MVYEIVIFVLADAAGSSFEHTGAIGAVEHWTFVVGVALACAASIGIRTRADERAARRTISAFIFGSVVGIYLSGFAALQYEATTASVLLYMALVAGGLVASITSHAAARFMQKKSARQEKTPSQN